MEPVGLTFKHEGTDKYGKHKQGEIMIIHLCQMCGKININRIAGDDDENNILSLLNPEAISKKILTSVSDSGIELLGKQNEDEVKKQLFGIQRI